MVRHCGNCKIGMDLNDFDSVECIIYDKQFDEIYRVNINTNTMLNNGIAIDSSEAYTQYAKSAIAFMINAFDSGEIEDEFDYDLDYDLDYYIRENRNYSIEDELYQNDIQKYM